jgi:isopenicillin N synthase-like dioxygenase
VRRYTAVVTASLIPSVDLTPILGGDFDAPASRRVLECLHAACAEIGFVTVTGHGVAAEVIDETAASARAFFALAEETKLDVAPRAWNRTSSNAYRGYFPSRVNGKEGLDIGEPELDAAMTDLLARTYYELNRFPDALGAAWRASVARYFDEFSSLGRLLMRALTAAQGGDPGRVASAFARPTSLSTLRFNYYPGGGDPVEISPQDEEPLSCETHVDSGFLTILQQGQIPGLQVRDKRERWCDVPCDPRTFVVNTGRALQHVSGGVLAATQHRVRQCREERLSIPFFLEPSFDFVVSPGSLGLSCTASGSESVSYESFLRESLSKFVEYDRGDP